MLLLIYICAYDDHRLAKELYLSKVRRNICPPGLEYVRRFHLNYNTQQCTEPYEDLQKLSDDQQDYAQSVIEIISLVPVQIDFPRINSNLIGKLYCYIYAVRESPNYKLNALVNPRMTIGPMSPGIKIY